MQRLKDRTDLACHDVKRGAERLECGVQFSEAFNDKFVMLGRHIRQGPELRLDNIETSDGPIRCGGMQRRMIVQP